MLRSVIRTWAFIGLTVFLGACGGDDIQGFTEFTDLRLSQLEVNGGTMLYAEVEVERFDPENLGPYRIEMDSEESTSFTITASAMSPNDVRLRLVETQKESDGSNSITEFNSGDTLSVDIDEGNSLVYVEVISRATGGVLRYNLTFNRVSSSAALSDVQVFGVRSYQGNNNVEFSQEVEAEIFSYQVNLTYKACSTSFIPFAENQFSTIRVNGELVEFNETMYLPLDVGSNIVNVDVTSEDEQNTQSYVFDLVRAAPTETDLAEEAYLSSLTFNGGRVFPSFRCNANELNITLGSEDDVVQMVATASQEDAEIIISPIVYNTTRNTWQVVDDENTQELTSGEVYSGPLLSGLEVGTTNVGVQVYSSDRSEAHLYRLVISRLDRKLVFVDTAEELQAALRSAEPNDQIIVAEGEYLGVPSDAASETGSGDLQAHFYSNMSGTIEEDVTSPIVLFGEGSGAVLIGDNTVENSVLKIQGNHWIITNIDIQESGKGLELIDASNIQANLVTATNTTTSSISIENSSEVTINGLIVSEVENSAVTLSNSSQCNIANFSIREVEGQAIILGEGSSSNVIKNGDINQIGADVPAESILVGRGDTLSVGNRIEFTNFGRNIAEEAILLTANASESYIQSNYFYSDNTALSPVVDRRLIRANGGDVTISQNEFRLDSYDGGTDDFESIININVGAASARIFDNLLTFDDETVPFINVESAATVETIANIHSSGEAPINIGDLVALDAMPAFQIQSTVDDSRCFQYSSVEINYETGESGVRDMVTLETCADIPEQRWVFRRNFENNVTISPEDMLEFKMSYASFIFTYLLEDVEEGEDPEQALIDGFLYLREDNGSVLDQQFSLYWKIENFGDGTILIQNKNDSAARIVESPLDPQEVEEELLFVRGRYSDEVNRFTLIPL